MSELDSKSAIKRIVLKRAKRNGNLEVNVLTEENRLSEQVFSIPLILKEILKKLDIKDLLRTSLINKNWNFFSREVLREKERCLAVVDGRNFCHNLKRLNNVLLNSGTVCFNGISLAVPWINYRKHECTVNADVSEMMGITSAKINMKYLALKFYYRNTSECIALACIREIIAKKASSLEGFSVGQFPCSTKKFSEFIGLDLQGQWLPNVRVLKFVFDSDLNEPLSMIKELVEASPKLQKLHGSVSTQWLEFLLPSKAVRSVTDFNFTPTISSLGYCAAFCLENAKLEKFYFSTEDDYDDGTRFRYWSEFHQNEVSRIIKHLLTSSQDSLKTITCDHFDLILMTFRWNIPVLKKVTHMSLGYDNYMDEGGGYTLEKINWAKYFPTLKEVDVTNLSWRHLDRDFYVENAFRESNSQFVCETVKILRWMWTDEDTMQMFKNKFPNLKEFHLKYCLDREFPIFLNQLWTAWPDLELIHAMVCAEESIPNYDSAFLGISEEEAAYLRANFEELESLEIVSAGPSIFNSRKLKKFKLWFLHKKNLCHETPSTPEGVFFSRLAGQCAFARMSGLEIKIIRVFCLPYENCQFALDHLKPFVLVK